MPKSATKSAPIPAPANPAQEPVDEKPAHVIHYGCVRGSIFRQKMKHEIIHTVTCQRVWRDSAQNEFASQTFQTGDLRMLAKVASECHRWIEWQERMIAEGRDPTA